MGRHVQFTSVNFKLLYDQGRRKCFFFLNKLYFLTYYILYLFCGSKIGCQIQKKMRADGGLYPEGSKCSGKHIILTNLNHYLVFILITSNPAPTMLCE